MDYKQQVLDALTAEYGAAMALVMEQERVVDGCHRRYSDTNEEFRERKLTGLTVAEAMGYQVGLQVLEKEIQREAERLEALRRQAEAKRLEMVEAKKDTASLEKLKEKKLDGYNKALQKSEEQFIDELVSSSWAVERQVAM